LKFLIIGKDIDYGGPISPMDLAMVLENVYLPSFERLKKWEQDKKVIGGFLAAQRGGVINNRCAFSRRIKQSDD